MQSNRCKELNWSHDVYKMKEKTPPKKLERLFFLQRNFGYQSQRGKCIQKLEAVFISHTDTGVAPLPITSGRVSGPERNPFVQNSNNQE